MESSRRRIVITVHGIRTFGQWQDRLRQMLLEDAPSIRVETYQYGYFSVVAFILPMLRWLAVRRFRAKLERLIAKNPGALFSFVGHSFGTHLLVHALRGIGPSIIKTVEVESIILSGSVLPSYFDWDRFIERVPVRTVINDCGINDDVLIFSQFFVLFTGMAGRIGFHGFVGNTVLNRFFSGGHSHYFEPTGADPDAFMRSYWLRTLLYGERPAAFSQRRRPTILGGMVAALLPFVDIAKLMTYGLMAWFSVNTLYLEPRTEARNQRATSEITAAATLLEADRLIPAVYASMAHLISTNAIPDVGQRQRASRIARYALQRLLPFQTAYKQLDDGTLFRWEGAVYLKKDLPVRIDITDARSYASVVALHRLVVLEADSTAKIFDAQSGAIVVEKNFSDIGEPIDELIYFMLPKAPSKVGVYFHEPSNDRFGGFSHSVVIDVAEATFKKLPHGFTTTRDCTDFILREVDDTFSEELEGELLTKFNEESKQLETCAVRSASHIKTFAFPASRSETDLWTVQDTPSPKTNTEAKGAAGCEKLAEAMHYSFRARHDGKSLDFSSLDDGEGALTGDWVEGFFENRLSGDPICFAEFDGPQQRTFIIAEPQIDADGYNSVLCEVTEHVRVRHCRHLLHSLASIGDLWISEDRSHVAVATDLDSGWEWINLGGLDGVHRDGHLVRGIVSIAISENAKQVMVASLVPAQPGAIELWAYRVDGGPKLAARRIFAPPQDFNATSSTSNLASQARLFVSGNNFYLATPFQQVVAFSLTYDDAMPRWARDIWSWWSGAQQGSEVLAISWLTPSAGFGGPVGYAGSPQTVVLAVFSSDHMRLLNLADGRFLTPLIGLKDLSACGGGITEVELLADESLTAHIASRSPRSDCTVQRQAPIAQATLMSAIQDGSIYLGEEDTAVHRLPGEVLANK